MVRLKNRTGVPISNSCSASLAPVGMTVSLQEASGHLLRKIALANRRLTLVLSESGAVLSAPESPSLIMSNVTTLKAHTLGQPINSANERDCKRQTFSADNEIGFSFRTAHSRPLVWRSSRTCRLLNGRRSEQHDGISSSLLTERRPRRRPGENDVQENDGREG